MNSISDSESPQSKTYVAGFVARAIAKVGTSILGNDYYFLSSS